MSTNIDQSLDDIIKLTQKKQATKGRGGATRGAGGARKTKQQIVQKQVNRQQQQQRRSKLSVPKGRLTRQGRRAGMQSPAATATKRLSNTPTPRQSAGSARGRGRGRGRVGGIAARLQRVQQASSQGVSAANRRRRGALGARMGRERGVAKNRVNRAALSVKKALATVQASRQAAHDAVRPQTRAVAAEISTASNNLPLASNLQISVGDAGYSRQVDTDPVGIDIGDFTIHSTSQTLNSRFTAIELVAGSRSPSAPPPHSPGGGSFSRKLHVVGRGRGRGRGEGVISPGGRGRGRGLGRR